MNGDMHTLRKVLRWMVLLVLLITAAGAGVGWWMYSRSDELLRQGILDKFAEIAPDWDVSIARANYDFRGRVRISGLAMKPRGQAEQLLTVVEAVLTVDSARFAERQQVVIERIQLTKPEVHLTRDRDGEWTWKHLPPIKLGDNALPEWDIEQGVALLHFEPPDGTAARTLRLEDVQLSLVPAAARQFVARGSVRVEHAGVVALDGTWHMDRAPWVFNSEIQGLPLGAEFVRMLADCSPELHEKLVRVGQWMRQQQTALASRTATPQINLTSRLNAPPLIHDLTARPTSLIEQGLTDLGIDATVDVHIRLEQPDLDTPPRHRLLVTIHNGQIVNPLLPFPLHGLRGRIYGDPERIVLRGLEAENGTTKLKAEGWLLPDGRSHYDVTLGDVVIDERLRGRLPESWLKAYDELHLSGRFDAALKLSRDVHSVWSYEVTSLTARGCALAHDKFPYPVREVHGTLTQRGPVIEIDLRGMAGQRPVTISGVVRDPGPDAEAAFAISVDQLPLDATAIAACPVAVQKTIAALNLKGAANCRARLVRPAGPDQKFQPSVALQLLDCSMLYEKFPYRLNHLSGYVSLKDDTWTMSGLQAQHDDAVLTGHGTFSPEPRPGRLDLTINAARAQFDKHLQMALPETLRGVWDELSPSGRFHLTDSRIQWTAGQPVTVALPKIELLDAGMMLRAFPYPIEAIQGELSYADGHVTIRSFSGRHDEMLIRGQGEGDFPPDGEWQVRLSQVYVDDLSPSPVLRRALPEPLRDVVEMLNPTGRISLNGNVEFRTTTRPRAPRARWDVQLVLSGTTLTAGIDLKDVHGRVGLIGQWDGQETMLDGTLELDSINVLEPNFQLTHVRGPFQLRDGRLTLGASEAFVPQRAGSPQRPVALDERVRGQVIDGWLTLDAIIDLANEPVYQMKLSLSRGSLERLAQRYLRASSNLQGVMNGWMSLQGRGLSKDRITGTGQLQISPASLYELPVLVQMFKVLRFDPNYADFKTAFHYADLNFQVRNSLFDFSSIDLVGDAISLRGFGFVRFDGAMMLDFYSMIPRNQLPIPILHEIVGQMSQGWYRVEVRGVVGNPEVRAKPVPQVEDTLKQFLSPLEIRRGRR